MDTGEEESMIDGYPYFLFRPFRALILMYAMSPRLSPWALLCRPFRA